MKKHLFLFLTIISFLSSCTEKGSLIDFSDELKSDTTYVLNQTEVAELRNVLAEEATGVICSNCPSAALVLKAAEHDNPGRLIVVGLHAGHYAVPAQASKYDLRNGETEKVFTLLGGKVPNFPSAAFDRTIQDGDYFIDSRNKWPAIIDERLQSKTPVNISLTSSFNESTGEDTIRIRISYTSSVSKPQSLAVVITEDNIVDYQLDGLKKDSFYVHNHVLRGFVTPVNGFSFLDTLSTREAGRVYERTFVYKLPADAFGAERVRWNLTNCHVIGFVFNNDAGDKEVMQAVQVKLKN